MALLVVAFVLVLSYAQSLRVYFQQQAQITATQQQIDADTATITSLQDELNRWKDDEYVRAQARARLGWVVPGETGYKVIGADGKPLGGGAEISATAANPPGEHATTWWERLLGSIKTADNPAPAPTATPPATVGASTLPSQATPPATVGPSTTPSASPTAATASPGR